MTRIRTRHFSLTKPRKDNNPTPSTFPLPLVPGAPLPTSHLSTKDAQAITKIEAEWEKIHALQEEKIALAERLERIVNRARERGRSEWKKVGGIDFEDLEAEAKSAILGELGGGEVMLPPGGLGTGSDGRPQKSSSSFFIWRGILLIDD